MADRPGIGLLVAGAGCGSFVVPSSGLAGTDERGSETTGSVDPVSGSPVAAAAVEPVCLGASAAWGAAAVVEGVAAKVFRSVCALRTTNNQGHYCILPAWTGAATPPADSS